MATNFNNYALSCDKDANIRLYKIKRSAKGNFPIVEEVGPDITYQALHCVAEHMEALYNQERTEKPEIGAMELQAEDGSRLVWYPAPAKGAE